MLIIGTAFTLFVVPSIYMLVARTHAPASEENADSESMLPEPADVVA